MSGRFVLCCLFLVVLPVVALADGGLPTVEKKTEGLSARSGLLTNFIDAQGGKAYLQLPKPDSSGKVGQFLYVESLATGLGSNDLGLDRTQLGATYVVDVLEIGDRVLLEAENLNFRSSSTDLDEKLATKEGFATSVLWAGKVVARSSDGTALTDITDLIVRDSHNSADRLDASHGYSLDSDRSLLDAACCKSFPDNLEFEALLTFHGSKASSSVGPHAPDARSVTVHQHLSLIRLPDDDYHPRAFDPRAGMFAIQFMDYSAPLTESLTKRYVQRFRLEKVDPAAAKSRVKKPIIYYVDRGVPEPVRSALVAGGNYWSKAFEAAGFIDAFRVEVMPLDVDPLDVRYNVVQWMNRSTRGYAYGQAIVDPRTGEVLKGAVNLDSQRVRQDILIFESLLGTEHTGSGRADDPIQIALTRMRQLAAHEIGHTLGFAHNFAASTYAGRASVMDYPAPMFRLTADGKIDLSQAYAKSIGAWDVQAVRYGYTEFAPGKNEAAGLKAIIQDGIQHGLKFLSDDDANEVDGADSDANRWDNLSDPLADLRNTLAVRQKALSKFGDGNLRKGAATSDLELVLGPLYFLHRYDVDAVAKLVGGFHYVESVKGDGQIPQRTVPAAKQWEALDALLGCLRPQILAIPPSLSSKMGPTPYGYESYFEGFPRWTSYSFDTMAAASAAGNMVLTDLLNPARCARVVELHTRDASLPTLEAILEKLEKSLIQIPVGNGQAQEISWTIQHALLSQLIELADSNHTSPSVLARADSALRSFVDREMALAKVDPIGHARYLATEAKRFLSRQRNDVKGLPKPAPAIPGAPIGG